jgi:hypothetical protein
MERIQDALYSISEQLVKDIKSEYIKINELLVPVSSAVLTQYDEKYLGIENG